MELSALHQIGCRERTTVLGTHRYMVQRGDLHDLAQGPFSGRLLVTGVSVHEHFVLLVVHRLAVWWGSVDWTTALEDVSNREGHP
jgi:hypothetical protein